MATNKAITDTSYTDTHVTKNTFYGRILNKVKCVRMCIGIPAVLTLDPHVMICNVGKHGGRSPNNPTETAKLSTRAQHGRHYESAGTVLPGGLPCPVPPVPGMPPSGPRSRNWAFTLNNPSQEVLDLFPTNEENLSAFLPSAYAIVYQLEAGELGTPHLQGYIRFRQPRARSYLARRILGGHFEPARGSPAQNLAYCTKEPRIDGPIVIPGVEHFGHGDGPGGDGGGDGKKYLSTTAVLALIEQDPRISADQIIGAGGLAALVRAPELLGRSRGLLIPDGRGAGITVHYMFGNPGCGKSRLASALYPDAYWKADGHWFDGYEGQQSVLLDDFDGTDVPFKSLLRLLDRYPYQGPVKHAFVRVIGNTFVITSNVVPEELYNVRPRRIAALCRRITYYYEFPPGSASYDRYDGSQLWPHAEEGDPSRNSLAPKTAFPFPWAVAPPLVVQ